MCESVWTYCVFYVWSLLFVFVCLDFIVCVCVRALTLVCVCAWKKTNKNICQKIDKRVFLGANAEGYALDLILIVGVVQKIFSNLINKVRCTPFVQFFYFLLYNSTLKCQKYKIKCITLRKKVTLGTLIIRRKLDVCFDCLI